MLQERQRSTAGPGCMTGSRAALPRCSTCDPDTPLSPQRSGLASPASRGLGLKGGGSRLPGTSASLPTTCPLLMPATSGDELKALR